MNTKYWETDPRFHRVLVAATFDSVEAVANPHGWMRWGHIKFLILFVIGIAS